MLKLRIQGTPDEVQALVEWLAESPETVTIEYVGDPWKRQPHHKWVTVKAGITMHTTPRTVPETVIHGQQRQRPGKTGIVYLVRVDLYGSRESIYKIGCAADLVSRKKALDLQIPGVVEVLCQIETDDRYKLENELHIRFDNKRLGKTEFFTLDEDDIAAIKELAHAD